MGGTAGVRAAAPADGATNAPAARTRRCALRQKSRSSSASWTFSPVAARSRPRDRCHSAESDLFELFNGVGAVQNAEVVTYRHNQRSKGFAFVQMNTVDEAKRAVEELHDKEFLGRKLVVSGAKSSEHHSAN